MTKLQIDQEEKDIRYRAYYDIPLSEDLEKMIDIELAEVQSKLQQGNPGLIIIENEWRRRDKIIQQKLNKELVKEQNKTVKIAGLYGVIGTIVGAILTAMFSR